MLLYGIDFTSAPKPRKPITWASGRLEDGILTLSELGHWPGFTQFEAFLQHKGEWLAAIDFPLSLPEKWISKTPWPNAWKEYVQQIGQMDIKEFCNVIQRYCDGQGVGKKHHRRTIDELANARSPMTIYYTPVGRMFFRGAPRLLASGVQVLPFMKEEKSRKVIEGYPALVARELIGKSKYKSDSKKLESKVRERMEANRQEMVNQLTSQRLQIKYGLQIELGSITQDLVDDPTGDTLDAVLCLIQAAWAAHMKTIGHSEFGIPDIAEAQEGWIADPGMWDAAYKKSFIPAP